MTFAVGIASSSTSAVVTVVVPGEIRLLATPLQRIEAVSLIIRYERALRCRVVFLSTNLAEWRVVSRGQLAFAQNQAISENNASVGVVQESNAIAGVSKEFFGTIDGLKAVPGSSLCTPDLELAHVDLRCGVFFFIAVRPAVAFSCTKFLSPVASAAMSLGMRGS